MAGMELTPKVFRDVQFREKLRGGYHPEDVDEFLEQAAVAVEATLEQLRLANERAQRAEQSVAEATANDEALRRMLVIAQRTADQAVAEAQADADKVLTEARSQAQALLADAEAASRQAHEDSQAQRQASLQQAEEALLQAQRETEALREWVEVHKNHLMTVLRDAQALVENAGLLHEPPPVTTELSSAPEAGPVEEGEHFSGVSDDNAAYQPHHAEEGADATAEWDPTFLQGLDGGDQGQPEASSPSGAVPSGPNMAGSTGGPTRGAAPATVQALPAVSGQSAAFDERALDNFFNDQDLKEERGAFGRFRRRQ